MPKRDAMSRSIVKRQRRAGVLLVGRDVAQFRQGLQLVEDLRRPGVELVEIGVLQRVLELRAREARADGDVLRRLQVEPGALHLRELRPQPRDDLEGVDVALVPRLQRDEHAAVVLRRVADAGAERHRHRVDRRVGLDDRAELLLQLDHLREGNVLRRFGSAEQNAGVLLREEALGNDDEQIDGRDDGGEEDQQRHEAMAQHDIERRARSRSRARRSLAR